jgi:hypothetical protein
MVPPAGASGGGRGPGPGPAGEGPGGGAQSTGTEKLRSSCDRCTALKIRCNKQTPTCGRCSTSGLACVYSPYRWKGRPSSNGAARAAAQAQAAQERAETQTQAQVQGISRSGSTPQHTPAPDETSGLASPIASSPCQPQSVYRHHSISHSHHHAYHISSPPPRTVTNDVFPSSVDGESSFDNAIDPTFFGLYIPSRDSCLPPPPPPPPLMHSSRSASSSSHQQHQQQLFTLGGVDSTQPLHINEPPPAAPDSDSGIHSLVSPTTRGPHVAVQSCCDMALDALSSLRRIPTDACRFKAADPAKALREGTVLDRGFDLHVDSLSTDQALKINRAALQTLDHIVSRNCTSCAVDSDLDLLLQTTSHRMLNVYRSVFECISQPQPGERSGYRQHRVMSSGSISPPSQLGGLYFSPVQFSDFKVDVMTAKRLNSQLLIYELKSLSKLVDTSKRSKDGQSVESYRSSATDDFGISSSTPRPGSAAAQEVLRQLIITSIDELVSEIEKFCQTY